MDYELFMHSRMKFDYFFNIQTHFSKKLQFIKYLENDIENLKKTQKN